MTEAQTMLAVADRLEKFGPEALMTRDEIRGVISTLRAAATAPVQGTEALADRILADPSVIWLRECGFNSSERFESTLKAAIMRGAPVQETGEPVAWWKMLADNWRGRNGNSVTGDSVRNSCADELEKVAKRHSLPSSDRPASAPADEIIGQIEARFPDWKGFRDLVDCIDVTLHRLRGGR